jgi:hypothetical protein
MKAIVAALIIPFGLAPVQLQAQVGGTTAVSARTSQLVAMFGKHKHAVKERHGVRTEKYKDVKSVPAVRANPAEYSGSYDGGLGFVLQLRVTADGKVEGSGEEALGDDARITMPFVLENAKVDGVLVTGTRIYRDGSRAKFEGVFIERTSRESESDPGATKFGIGVVTRPTPVNGLLIERLFYERDSQ